MSLTQVISLFILRENSLSEGEILDDKIFLQNH